MDITLENLKRLAEVAREACNADEVTELVLQFMENRETDSDEQTLKRLFVIVSTVASFAVSATTHVVLDEEEVEMLHDIAQAEMNAQFDRELQQILDEG